MGNKFGFEEDKIQDAAELELDNISSVDNPDSAHIKVFSKNGIAYSRKSDGTEVNLEAGASGTDTKKVLVSANDTTENYLYPKLYAGPGITLTEQNDGGNETVKMEVNNTVGTSRHSAICGKTGNAGNGTYLEFFRAISSSDSPWVVAEEGEIKSLAASFKNNSTITFSVRVNGSEVDTLTVTSDNTGSKAGLSHYVDVNDEISVLVTSGSARDVIFFTSILVYI